MRSKPDYWVMAQHRRSDPICTILLCEYLKKEMRYKNNYWPYRGSDTDTSGHLLGEDQMEVFASKWRIKIFNYFSILSGSSMLIPNDPENF